MLPLYSKPSSKRKLTQARRYKELTAIMLCCMLSSCTSTGLKFPGKSAKPLSSEGVELPEQAPIAAPLDPETGEQITGEVVPEPQHLQHQRHPAHDQRRQERCPTQLPEEVSAEDRSQSRGQCSTAEKKCPPPRNRRRQRPISRRPKTSCAPAARS